MRISFESDSYTFQQIAYLADIYNKKSSPGGLIEYAFFITFFPQLIAGPILHYNQIIPQIGKPKDTARLFLEGSVYFAIGFVKKFFIADGFAAFSDPIYGGQVPIDTQSALIAMLGYTFQLYFDFSGYSDMALGLARMFGFELPWNFDSPYKARSISDFWRRWHMTLSRFLRDYIYVPFGGNRHGTLRRYRNLLLTMLIGGLWHGAAWTFVAWGALHGLALVINQLWDRYARIRLFGLGWVLTFVVVALLWVLFRASSFEQAMEIYGALLDFNPIGMDHQFWPWAVGGIAVTFLLPNSHWLVGRIPANLGFLGRISVRQFSYRIAVYAIISSAVLYGLSYAYYATPAGQYVYTKVNASTYESGLTNKSGDFRNNLWSKILFSMPGERIALVGSSFVRGSGDFEVRRGDMHVAYSQVLAMGGNGMANGARAALAVAGSGQADIIVMGISPLNFGKTALSAPFRDECLDYLTPETLGIPKLVLPKRPLGDCLPNDPGPEMLLSIFSPDRTDETFQFKNFVRNVANAPANEPEIFTPMDVDAAADYIAAIKAQLTLARTDTTSVRNPDNGKDTKFKWNDRGIEQSLLPGNIAYQVLKTMKQEADRNGITLLVYETPAPAKRAADMYPEGFFDSYQNQIRATLSELQIPYLDLSEILPWNGAAMMDFIHPQVEYRQIVHKLVLAWIFAPDQLRASGLLTDVPEIPRKAHP